MKFLSAYAVVFLALFKVSTVKVTQAASRSFNWSKGVDLIYAMIQSDNHAERYELKNKLVTTVEALSNYDEFKNFNWTKGMNYIYEMVESDNLAEQYELKSKFDDLIDASSDFEEFRSFNYTKGVDYIYDMIQSNSHAEIYELKLKLEDLVASAVSENSDSELPADSEITEEELQKEEELEDYYDHSWKEQLMAPIRNVGQMVSGGVASAADSINTGLSAANEWWDGGSGDADYEPYENEYDQVNNWWDAMEQEQYEYDEKEENSEKKETEEEVDLDYDGYESIWDEIKYPKPEESKVEAKQIHKPSETRVVLKRMKNRNQQPYGVDDYFDFVVIAMCCVLLFIMMLAGVSRYNNQRYLKKTYGRESNEKSPLLRA